MSCTPNFICGILFVICDIPRPRGIEYGNKIWSSADRSGQELAKADDTDRDYEFLCANWLLNTVCRRIFYTNNTIDQDDSNSC